MKDQKNLWVWVGVAVVVLVAVAAGVTWFLHRGQSTQMGPVPVHAPAGQVVDGFPKALILGAASSSSDITNSYSINYSTSTNQYTAEWTSTSTPAALYAEYQTYVVDNGWTITNHVDTATLKGIYAMNASSSVINVVIVPQSQTAQNKGSKVNVSYVAQ
jgi:hypothetical protein